MASVVDEQRTEWAVEDEYGEIVECGTDEAKARELAKSSGGQLKARQVFQASWA